MLAGVLAAGSNAEASAYGYSFWGVHTFKDVPVPAGTVFGAIQGAGLNWRDVGGSFESVGTVCNWNFTVTFYEGPRSANKATKVDEPIQNGCARIGAFKLGTLARPAAAGSVCIELYRQFGDEAGSPRSATTSSPDALAEEEPLALLCAWGAKLRGPCVVAVLC